MNTSPINHCALTKKIALQRLLHMSLLGFTINAAPIAFAADADFAAQHQDATHNHQHADEQPPKPATPSKMPAQNKAWEEKSSAQEQSETHADHGELNEYKHAQHDEHDHAKHSQPSEEAAEKVHEKNEKYTDHAEHDDHKNHGDHEEHTGHAEHSDTANLTAAQLSAAAIELAQVGPANIRPRLPLYGAIEANGEKIQRLSARFSGTVQSVNKKVGDTVRLGEVLATVQSNESLKNYNLVAALDGVVAERTINIGEQTSDQPAFVIINLASVWVDIAVFPKDADKIHLGQTVIISHPHNGFTQRGEITALSPRVTPGDQTLHARVVLDNSARRFSPGLFVNTQVLLEATAAATAISNNAVQEHEGQQVIFIKGQEGFAPRPVKLGRSDGEFTEVLSGVRPGEVYASKNSFIIKAQLGKAGAAHEH